ncbi:hypothetical protein EWI07_03885 [Sporolactobacillus sp. THM7-4]|nr:hypothetical protein EWI07_03885 [Sporolactobacillus sp. THM7-4]
MRGFRNVFSALIAALFIFSVPLGALAEDQTPVKSIVTNIQGNLSQGGQPYKEKTVKDNSYTDPSQYPLVAPGQYVGTLSDSRGTTHTITYNNTTEYSPGQMQIGLGYQSASSYKDGYLNVEFFTNQGGTLNFLGKSPFNVSYFNNANLNTIIDKSLYENDPYIYLRVGVLSSPYDSYYSDVLTFKVSNPFYSGSTPPASSGDYYLISNESPDGNSSENTGTFKINNDKYSFSKKISKSAYKMDYVKPFDPAKDKSNVLRDRMRSLTTDQLGDSKLFWVSNLQTNEDYQLNATLLYSGSHSNVWVNDNQITPEEAAQLGQEFDNHIHRVDTENFGNESDVDGNGKVNILCYDIQDGFSGSGGYIAGYFYPGDLYNVPDSNHSEIFYIDTYPLMGFGSTKDVSAADSTLAHEFQHMINYNQKVFVQGKKEMDTWMNEGLSMAAEQIYSGHALNDRIDYYNYDSSIANGQSLLYWDYSGDTLANYSLSYLFMQYLKIQCGQGDHVFKELIDDPNSDDQAIQDLIRKYINPNLTFGQFMTDFREALYLKQSTGLFGFHGDPGFNGIQQRIYSGSSLNLRGGGAIVKLLDPSSIPTDKGSDITYTDLSDSGSTDTTAPNPPNVNTVGDNDTTVTGTAEAGSTITVTADGQQIGLGNADNGGSFSVTIPKQKAGAVLNVYATDAAGNKSSATTITVKDRTAPPAPTVNAVGDNDTTVTGTAEAGSTITVTADGQQIGLGNADNGGSFSVTIPKQKAKTELNVYATDAAGNKSSATTITVKDRTAPPAPTVNAVGDNDTTVTGTAEAGSTITVTADGQQIGLGNADNGGSFSVTIPKQKAGTVLNIYATDAAGNKSYATTIAVKDRTAPPAPTVNGVKDDDTSLTGKAERNAAITVFANGKPIAQGHADGNGTFKMSIPKQKAGTALIVYATDSSGNKSTPATIKVVSSISAPLKSSQVKITNNKGKSDTVYVNGLKKGDVIRVYNSGYHLLATGTSKGSSITLSIKQLGSTSGKIHLTITHPGMTASSKTAVSYSGEPSTALKSAQVKVTNNKGKSDPVYVTGIKKGDVIRVYNSGHHLLATGTSKGSSITLSIKQLGSTSRKLYLTITHPGMTASSKTAVSCSGEVSDTLSSHQIRVNNNRHKSDTVTITKIKKGDYIRVYNSRKHLIATKKSGGSSTTLSIRQLGKGSGHIYVTTTHPGMRESGKKYVSFRKE